MTKHMTNRWLTIALVAVMSGSLLVPRWRNLLGHLTVAVIRPISRMSTWLADSLRIGSSVGELTSQRQQLQHQVDDLTARLFEANQLLETAQAISALNQFRQSTPQSLVFATVLAISPDPGIQSLVIDRGSDDGLRPGQVIVSDHGYVVGKIATVHQRFSTALLLTDRQSKITARVQNDAQSPGVIRGERGLSLLMEFIPKTDQLKDGQTVVTTGSDPFIPPNLFVGTITSVSRKSGELFQQATVAPAATLQRLRVVGILLPART